MKNIILVVVITFYVNISLLGQNQTSLNQLSFLSVLEYKDNVQIKVGNCIYHPNKVEKLEVINVNERFDFLENKKYHFKQVLVIKLKEMINFISLDQAKKKFKINDDKLTKYVIDKKLIYDNEIVLIDEDVIKNMFVNNDNQTIEIITKLLKQ